MGQRVADKIINAVRKRYALMRSHLDERGRRLWAGSEAITLGHGGVQAVHEATGLAWATVDRGVTELQQGETKPLKTGRVRQKGGGRKPLIEMDKALIADIEAVVDPATLGDPESPLKWTSKSLRKIANDLNRDSHRVSHNVVGKILEGLEYNLQANRKVNEGGNHPDRDAQFEFIADKVKDFQKRNQPVISVDTKKKELVGEYKNPGREYHKKGNPVNVKVYDFIDAEKGRASPYGVYDITKNDGWVSVGISNDTAEFAVNSIRSWWKEMGEEAYPTATEIYINADGGGSNGSRVRLWKTELQKLANELNKVIHVSHFPPGTSKWNKIEHKMFCFISKNWRGRPLVDTATIVRLIGSTTTDKGLKIRSMLDEKKYAKGIKISDEELEKVALEKSGFHGEWNYKICPIS